jgi:3-oxoacyl-[acyl-carrier protein] reductase
MLLESRRALVTGGTSGIGREIALEYAKQGAWVAIIGTHAERAKKVLDELEKLRVSEDQKFTQSLLDVGDKQSVDRVVSELLTLFGRIDILVNNAGITRDVLLMKMDEQDWDLVIDTNLKSVFNFCRALIRLMLRARGGKIINISSVVGLTGHGGQVNYAASKSGMIGFTKALADEVAAKGITVNAIAPGFIETGMTDALSEEQKNHLLQKIPMRRWGKPQEVAKAALFLASDWSDYITGQVITVDGGMVR